VSSDLAPASLYCLLFLLQSAIPRRGLWDVYIAIHKGDPLDYQKYRHTGVWLVPVGGSGSNYYCHIRGTPGEFVYETRTNYDPQSSRTFAKLIGVARTTKEATAAEITDVMRLTPVQNDNWEFNCQIWVETAVKRLYQQGYISEKQYFDGTDAMVEATMEAVDEPVY
jgi:hypothetical protein